MEVRYIFLILQYTLIHLWSVNGLIQTIPLPKGLSDCFDRRTRGLTVQDIPGHAINTVCLNTYKLKDIDKNQNLDVPLEIIHWIQSLLRKFVSNRKKRQTFPRRVRKEIRALTDDERREYFDAVLALKADTSISPNKWDALARLHSGNLTIANAHDSSNFVGWHRVFLIVAEEALRTKNPRVTIPYWDSTKDFEMHDPVMSVLWTSEFFGNGDGIVTSGPFANWITGDDEPLVRNIGSSGSLMSSQGVRNVLSRTYHIEINEGTADPENTLEIQHNAVHNWVDGTMAGLNTAPQDPVFFSHHAFVDYVWYLFRRQQISRGINPAADYPPTNNSFHQPFYRMVGFEPLRNIDGYSNFWDEIVTYEMSPECRQTGHCNSFYLVCVDGFCVSRDSSAVGERPGGLMEIMAHSGLSPSMVAAKKMGPLPIGRRFPYFFIDSRTRNDPLQTMNMKKKKHGRRLPGNVMSMSSSIPGNDRRHVGTFLHNSLSSWRFQKAEHSAAISSRRQHKFESKISVDQTYQNTFLLDGVADKNRWVYFPVQIIHRRPSGLSFQSKLITHGHLIDKSDMYSPSNYQNLKRYFTSGSDALATYGKCSKMNAVMDKVFVQSDGISYSGRYKDYAVIDGRQPMSSSMLYIAVKNPKLGPSKAYISAYDHCGRMCKPSCLVPSSYPPRYQTCSGAINLTEDFPKMFGRDFGEAVAGTWDLKTENCPSANSDRIYLTFYCDYQTLWPWQN